VTAMADMDQIDRQALSIMVAGIVQMLRDLADVMERGDMPMMQGPEALRTAALTFDSVAGAELAALARGSR
jgi:hypothetical protein